MFFVYITCRIEIKFYLLTLILKTFYENINSLVWWSCFPFTRFNQFTLKYLNPFLFRIQRIAWRKRGKVYILLKDKLILCKIVTFFFLLVWIFQNLKEFKSELLLMSVLIPFCLIDSIKESFNIKVEKGNVLMRNLKDLVGTEDYLNRLELTFHQFLHLINFASFLSTCCWLFLVYVININICHPIFKLGYLSSIIFFLFQKYSLIFIQRSVCVCVITENLFQGTGKPIYFLFE
jgi:hypothetical protein